MKTRSMTAANIGYSQLYLYSRPASLPRTCRAAPKPLDCERSERVLFGTILRMPLSAVYEAKVRAAAGLDHVRTLASGSDLVARTLSSFHVEMHEYPSGSGNLSDLPIRIWVLPLKDRQAIEISVDPSGDSIQMHFGNPEPVDMGEFGRTLILPQFSDAKVCEQSMLHWRIEPCDEGQKLILGLSGGSELTVACHGDDELRASIS